MGGSSAEEQWVRQFQALNPEIDRYEYDTTKLRLILGTGRSGTTWLMRVLVETSTPIRAFVEGLSSVKPRLPFGNACDNTAIAYCPVMEGKHPLLCIFRSLITQFDQWETFGLDEHIQRNDLDWQLCLMKEVHALLSTEALLKSLKCPTVLVVRNPVYVVDSLFARDGLGSPYLRVESQAVKDPIFLERFFNGQNGTIKKIIEKSASQNDMRKSIILERGLTVAIIHWMLRRLASEFQNSLLIDYDELCRYPELLFKVIADFFGLINPARKVEEFLSATTTFNKKKETNDYPVFRDTKKQVNRGLKFLTQMEATDLHQVIQDCGIENHSPFS